jgi:hypothetical protein
MSEIIIPKTKSKRLRFSWQVIQALTELGFTDFQAHPRRKGKSITPQWVSVNGLRWPYYLAVIKTAMREAGYIPPRHLSQIISLIAIGYFSTDWMSEFSKWLKSWVSVWRVIK